MELPAALPVAMVPAVRRSPLPDLHPTDVIPPAPRASDASAAVHPDEAADAIPALGDAPRAEKLAVPAQAVPASDAKLHPARTLPAEAEALCILGAGPSAA